MDLNTTGDTPYDEQKYVNKLSNEQINGCTAENKNSVHQSTNNDNQSQNGNFQFNDVFKSNSYKLPSNSILADNNDIFKYGITKFFESACEVLSNNIIWFYYKEKSIEEKCAVCNIKLINNDKCRISDCDHNFHADCIARYCDRVKNCCPVCNKTIESKLATIDECQKYLSKFQPN
jgi:hypothetical protein